MHLLTTLGGAPVDFGQALMVVTIGIAGGFFLGEARLLLTRALRRVGARRKP